MMLLDLADRPSSYSRFKAAMDMDRVPRSGKIRHNSNQPEKSLHRVKPVHFCYSK